MNNLSLFLHKCIPVLIFDILKMTSWSKAVGNNQLKQEYIYVKAYTVDSFPGRGI